MASRDPYLAEPTRVLTRLTHRRTMRVPDPPRYRPCVRLHHARRIAMKNTICRFQIAASVVALLTFLAQAQASRIHMLCS
jgi:hypothetical protein